MSFPFFHRKAPIRALFSFLGTLSPAFLLKNAENFCGEAAAALPIRTAKRTLFSPHRAIRRKFPALPQKAAENFKNFKLVKTKSLKYDMLSSELFPKRR